MQGRDDVEREPVWGLVDENEMESGAQIDEYDLTSSPNDFNVLTIQNFIESGAVKIPAFQRNYVWDIKKASRLIESLILGLPVPQIFLYEQGRNDFLVVDGQQRLMTIYYFIKGRFPKGEKRAAVRKVFDDKGSIPTEVLFSDEFFEDFKLRLPEVAGGQKNRFSGVRYETLGEYKSQFDLRTIRNIIVKQIKPSDDSSSIFEMFNRLNTGGSLLTPQEIRGSLYHSDFLSDLTRVNTDSRWRRLVGSDEPDLHMRDVEMLLRLIAMWHRGSRYRPSMAAFLNKFADQARSYGVPDRSSVMLAINWFLEEVSERDISPLQTDHGRPLIALLEAGFVATVQRREQGGDFKIPHEFFSGLSADADFRSYTDYRPTDRQNVAGRLGRAATFLDSLLASDSADT
jgi:hypothetical protein